uniref:Uncharacterized protein n=1 Tax=Yamadaella caenomyce TaxID=259029 RepID=A0A1G4NZ03_9FLOR|nr:Hypothetical protein ORF_11 [Yamadaella caenomyce]SCW23877.1 Hypothetical protein ORF_11 [Yamadaella caenomyce]
MSRFLKGHFLIVHSSFCKNNFVISITAFCNNDIYDVASIEVDAAHVDFVISSRPDLSYSFFVLSFCITFMSRIDQSVTLQVIIYNYSAVSLYLWVGYNVTGVFHLFHDAGTYFKLKFVKSKTKNVLRRFLI